MRWHRRLVAQKWYYSKRRGPGRPGIMREISELIVRMAMENPKWGYTRIEGALANLRHTVGRGTVAAVLKAMELNRRQSAESTPGRRRF
jgi:hypothetical protein